MLTDCQDYSRSRRRGYLARPVLRPDPCPTFLGGSRSRHSQPAACCPWAAVYIRLLLLLGHCLSNDPNDGFRVEMPSFPHCLPLRRSIRQNPNQSRVVARQAGSVPRTPSGNPCCGATANRGSVVARAAGARWRTARRCQRGRPAPTGASNMTHFVVSGAYRARPSPPGLTSRWA